MNRPSLAGTVTYLRARQPVNTPAQAGDALTRYIPTIRLRDAYHFLRDQIWSMAILEQYQRIWPADFAASEARLHRTNTESYSPRELEFFNRVNEELFPINVDWLESMGSAEERDLAIPVTYGGVDLFDEIDQREGWSLLAFFAGYYSDEYFDSELYERTPDEIAELIALEARLPGIPNIDHLRDMLVAEQSPLSGLPDALEMLEHETGTTFLDPSPDQDLEGYEWSTEVVDQLRSEWIIARPIIDQTYAFLEWLEADVMPHAREVAAVWRAAILPQDPR